MVVGKCGLVFFARRHANADGPGDMGYQRDSRPGTFLALKFRFASLPEQYLTKSASTRHFAGVMARFRKTSVHLDPSLRSIWTASATVVIAQPLRARAKNRSAGARACEHARTRTRARLSIPFMQNEPGFPNAPTFSGKTGVRPHPLRSGSRSRVAFLACIPRRNGRSDDNDCGGDKRFLGPNYSACKEFIS